MLSLYFVAPPFTGGVCVRPFGINPNATIWHVTPQRPQTKNLAAFFFLSMQSIKPRAPVCG